MRCPKEGNVELAVVGFGMPHAVFTAGQLEIPTAGAAKVLPLTFQSTTVLVRLEAVSMEASYEMVAQVLLTGDGQEVLVGGAVGAVEPVQSAESTGSAVSPAPLAAEIPRESTGSAESPAPRPQESPCESSGNAESPAPKESPKSSSSVTFQFSGASEILDDCQTVKSETFFETESLRVALAPRLTVQRKALADQVNRASAGACQFTLCNSAGPQDMTTLPDWRIEQALQNDASLPGWDYQADTQKHLAYLKVYFDCRTKNYLPNSMWSTAQVPKRILSLVQEVQEHMQIFMSKAENLETLDERSIFDLEVAQVWLQHAASSRIPHGPLLGWAKMKGHELYTHEWRANEKPFLMARAPGTPYEESLHCKQRVSYFL